MDPLTKKYPELTPYQFASNRPIDGIDLDGLEFFKRDNTSYRIEYQTVTDANNVLDGANRASHNVIAFLWNGTFGAVGEGNKALNNYLAGGYKERTTTPMEAFEGANHYFAETPLKQLGQDLKQAATDPTSYEIAPSLLIAHTIATPKVATMSATSANIIEARMSLAKDFFKKSGVSEIDRHMAAVHFEKGVSSQTLATGTELYRYTEIGTANPKHYFFTEPLTGPTEVGKGSMYRDPSKFVLEKYTLNKPVKALKSTTDIGGTPGAQQVFSTEIQGASTVEQGTWGETGFIKK